MRDVARSASGFGVERGRGVDVRGQGGLAVAARVAAQHDSLVRAHRFERPVFESAQRTQNAVCSGLVSGERLDRLFELFVGHGTSPW